MALSLLWLRVQSLVREQDPTSHAVQPKKKKKIDNEKNVYCLNVKNLVGLLNKEHVKHKD